jgi:hypothetical protein
MSPIFAGIYRQFQVSANPALKRGANNRCAYGAGAMALAAGRSYAGPLRGHQA